MRNILVVVRSFLSVRKNLAEGKATQLVFSRQFGTFHLDFKLHLTPGGQTRPEGHHSLHKKVSEILLSQVNEKKPKNKSPLMKKPSSNPFVENLSKMEGSGPKIGPAFANLAEMRRII